MAEEVISSWETIGELILELALFDDANVKKTQARMLEAFEGLTSGQQDMEARPEDAEGNEVRFPLTLISDTTFSAS